MSSTSVVGGPVLGATRRLPVVAADPEWASAALTQAYCPVEIDPLDPVEEFSLAMSLVDLGPLTLGQLTYGADITLDAGDDRRCYIVQVPLAGSIEATYTGRRITATPKLAAVFGPSGDVVLEHWPADSPQLCLRLDQQVLEDRLQERLDAAVVSPVQFEFGLDLAGPAARGWLSALRILAAELEQPGGLAAQPVLAAEIQQLIIVGLLLCQQHNYSEALRRPGSAPRPKAVQLVTDLIKEQPDQPWTIPQLATAAGISVRALEDGFRRYVGVPPRTYLRECRLRCAHEELERSSPTQASVTDVAYRWGFTHLGRFAQEYRRRYGVTPSTTLRSAGRRHL